MTGRHRTRGPWRDRVETAAPPVVAAGLMVLSVFQPLLALVVCAAGWIALDIAERLAAAKTTHPTGDDEKEAPR